MSPTKRPKRRRTRLRRSARRSKTSAKRSRKRVRNQPTGSQRTSPETEMRAIAGRVSRVAAIGRGPSLMLVFALVAGCGPSAGEGPGHRSQALALSPAQEVALGEQAYREVLRKSPAVQGGAAT